MLDSSGGRGGVGSAFGWNIGGAEGARGAGGRGGAGGAEGALHYSGAVVQYTVVLCTVESSMEERCGMV